MDLAAFSRRIRGIGTEVVVRADRNMVATAGLILTGVVTSTPVDTGRARGNWIVSIGSPVTLPNLKSLDKTGQATISRGQAVAERYASDSLQSIYICNNLPYIQRLNEGWSAQAPAGYVQAAVQTAVAYLRTRTVLPP